MTYTHNKELFGVFTLLTTCTELRALRLARRREDSSDKFPLTKGTRGEVECWFNGLALQSSKERSIMGCCLPCDPIDNKYDSSRMDIGDEFLTHVI